MGSAAVIEPSPSSLLVAAMGLTRLHGTGSSPGSPAIQVAAPSSASSSDRRDPIAFAKVHPGAAAAAAAPVVGAYPPPPPQFAAPPSGGLPPDHPLIAASVQYQRRALEDLRAAQAALPWASAPGPSLPGIAPAGAYAYAAAMDRLAAERAIAAQAQAQAQRASAAAASARHHPQPPLHHPHPAYHPYLAGAASAPAGVLLPAIAPLPTPHQLQLRQLQLPTPHQIRPIPNAKNFPETLFDVVSAPEFQHVVSWLHHGRGFIIRDKKEFADVVLPRYFDGAKFTSFTRRLKRWNFKRVPRGPELGAYYNKRFRRDEPKLVLEMRYRTDGGRFEESKEKDDGSKGSDSEDEDEDDVDSKTHEGQGDDKAESKQGRVSPKRKTGQGKGPPKRKVSRTPPGASREAKATPLVLPEPPLQYLNAAVPGAVAAPIAPGVAAAPASIAGTYAPYEVSPGLQSLAAQSNEQRLLGLRRELALFPGAVPPSVGATTMVPTGAPLARMTAGAPLRNLSHASLLGLAGVPAPAAASLRHPLAADPVTGRPRSSSHPLLAVAGLGAPPPPSALVPPVPAPPAAAAAMDEERPVMMNRRTEEEFAEYLLMKKQHEALRLLR
ncbi:hypothetical protein ACHAWF_011631 [Thalassiosira exigua]